MLKQTPEESADHKASANEQPKVKHPAMIYLKPEDLDRIYPVKISQVIKKPPQSHKKNLQMSPEHTEEMRAWRFNWLLNLQDIRKWKKWREQRVGREIEPLRIAERNVMTGKPMQTEKSTGLTCL